MEHQARQDTSADSQAQRLGLSLFPAPIGMLVPWGNAAELVTLEWSQLAHWRAGDECYVPEGPKSGIGIGLGEAQSQGYPKSPLWLLAPPRPPRGMWIFLEALV